VDCRDCHLPVLLTRPGRYGLCHVCTRLNGLRDSSRQSRDRHLLVELERGSDRLLARTGALAVPRLIALELWKRRVAHRVARARYLDLVARLRYVAEDQRGSVLEQLDQARLGSRFPSARRVPARAFRWYVIGCLVGTGDSHERYRERLTGDQLPEIFAALDAMVGVDSLRYGFADIDRRLHIALLNGEPHVALAPPPSLYLRDDERLLAYIENVALHRPATREDYREGEGGLMPSAGPVSAGLKRRVKMIAQRTGPFALHSDGALAVTDRELSFTGGTTVQIPVADIIRIELHDEERITIHHRGEESPSQFVAADEGPVIDAAVRHALRAAHI